MSEEQLERKRANDREAQRIIRKNTREHIENLERQVAQFGDKEQQLNKALLRNSQLEAQVATQQAYIAKMTVVLRQSCGIGGRNDTGSTGGWHSAPTALQTPGILTGHRPKYGTQTSRLSSSITTRMREIRPNIRADAQAEPVWGAANRFNLPSLKQQHHSSSLADVLSRHAP